MSISNSKIVLKASEYEKNTTVPMKTNSFDVAYKSISVWKLKEPKFLHIVYSRICLVFWGKVLFLNFINDALCFLLHALESINAAN